MRRANLTSLGDRRHQLLDIATGLCGEANELYAATDMFASFQSDANRDCVALELGDVVWYAVALAYLLGVKIIDETDMNVNDRRRLAILPIVRGHAESVLHHATFLAGRVQRVTHGRDVDMDAVSNALDGILVNAVGISVTCGGLCAVLDANVNKLRARYGDAGFSREAARKLDLAPEWTGDIK